MAFGAACSCEVSRSRCWRSPSAYEAGRAHRRAGPAEARLLPRLAELAAEAEREPAQRRVARDLGPCRGEVVRVVVQLLRLHEIDLGAVAEHELERAVEVAGLARGELLDAASAARPPRRPRACARACARRPRGSRRRARSGRPTVTPAGTYTNAPPLQVAEFSAMKRSRRSSTLPRWRSTSSAVRLDGVVQRREHDARGAHLVVEPDEHDVAGRAARARRRSRDRRAPWSCAPSRRRR